jgi:hypothetical protein
MLMVGSMKGIIFPDNKQSKYVISNINRSKSPTCSTCHNIGRQSSYCYWCITVSGAFLILPNTEDMSESLRYHHNSGIGSGIALRLARDGAKVVVNYVKDKKSADVTFNQQTYRSHLMLMLMLYVTVTTIGCSSCNNISGWFSIISTR